MNQMFLYFFLSLFFGWLIILTYYILITRKHYFKLTERTGKHRIDEILERLMRDDKINSQEIIHLSKNIEEINKQSVLYLKKIGLIRYDPFGKTEGEKSFIFSLLNENNDGLVMNFLYTHDGVRVYTKKIKQGKGIEHELSEEEKKAVEKAD